MPFTVNAPSQKQTQRCLRLHQLLVMGLFLLILPALAIAQDDPFPDDPNVFREQIQLWWVFIPTIFFAGLSEAVGQSFVLFINRVKPSRFIPSVLLNALLFLFGYFETVFVLWLTARFLLGYEQVILQIMYAVGVSYVPLLLSFLTLLPYLGPGIVRLLYLASYTILVSVLHTRLDFPIIEAAATVLLSFVVQMVVRATIGRPLRAAVRSIRNRIAGTPLEQNIMKAMNTIDSQFAQGDAK